jgi:hypothetical protein
MLEMVMRFGNSLEVAPVGVLRRDRRRLRLDN